MCSSNRSTTLFEESEWLRMYKINTMFGLRLFSFPNHTQNIHPNSLRTESELPRIIFMEIFPELHTWQISLILKKCTFPVHIKKILCNREHMILIAMWWWLVNESWYHVHYYSEADAVFWLVNTGQELRLAIAAHHRNFRDVFFLALQLRYFHQMLGSVF